MSRRAEARINLAAIERNCRRLVTTASPARLMAAVKANAYGHGAISAARAAITGGATSLAVVTVEELVELRDAGIEVPILLMGALTASEAQYAAGLDADIVVWRESQVRELVEAVSGGKQIAVHIKLDSGLGRLGTRDTEEATQLVEYINSQPNVRLAGFMTHFATADGDQEFMALQLAKFNTWLMEFGNGFPTAVTHAANSAATLGESRAHYDLVRCGGAIYGMNPFGRSPDEYGLEPALELVSYVAEVKRCVVGESVGYGRRFIARADTLIATVPIGYGDGVSRALSNGGEVLVDGRRYPIVGAISMDNLTINLGVDADVLIGAEVVVIGRRGREGITVEEVGTVIGTINYEVTTGLLPRVDRIYHRDGIEASESGEAPRGATSEGVKAVT